MTATPHDRLRYGLALVAVLGEGGILSRMPSSANLSPLAFWPGRLALSVLGTTPGLVLAIGVTLVAAWGITRPRTSAAAATAMFVLMGASSLAEGSSNAGLYAVSHGIMLPGALMAAYVVATTLRRDAIDITAGVIGGAYLLATTSKLRASGLAWINGQALSLLIAERLWLLPAPIRPIAAVVADHPILCGLVMTVSLLIEGLGICLLWPRARMWFLPCSWALHLGIGALMGYPHLEWPVAVTTIALATRTRDRAR